jgi:sRNA-binding carbon storage regulator CsrA
MALVLSRRLGQRIRIKVGDHILWIRVHEVAYDGRVKLLLEGPMEFKIDREEKLPEGERYVETRGAGPPGRPGDRPQAPPG